MGVIHNTPDMGDVRDSIEAGRQHCFEVGRSEFLHVEESEVDEEALEVFEEIVKYGIHITRRGEEAPTAMERVIGFTTWHENKQTIHFTPGNEVRGLKGLGMILEVSVRNTDIKWEWQNRKWRSGLELKY